MNKSIVLLVVAAGMCGPAGAATRTPTMSNTAATSCATGTTNNVPCQIDQLQAEVQVLQGQVQALQSSNPTQNAESAGELTTIGVGG